jgi:hypothetical protein
MSEWLDNVRSFLAAPEVSGVSGAIISLRWLPVGSTWANRFASMACGLSTAVFLVPYLLDVAGIKSNGAAGAFSFIGGLFGLLLLSRAWEHLSKVEFGGLLAYLFPRQKK